MRIGRISLRWIKKNPWGRDIHPWEEITLDQLSPELRQLVTKMARVASRDFFEEVRETFWEAVSIELGKRIQDALAGVQGDPEAVSSPTLRHGLCELCGQPDDGRVKTMPHRGGWGHAYPESLDAIGCAGVFVRKDVNS